MAKLIIKYQNDYIVERDKNKYKLIDVPTYYLEEDFSNISIFIILFCGGILSNNYESLKPLNYFEGLELNEKYFFPDCLFEIDEGVYLYDLDEVIKETYFSRERFLDKIFMPWKETLDENIKRMPQSLISFSDIPEFELPNIDFPEEVPIMYRPLHIKTKELNDTIKMLSAKKTDKDVLLMYSGGKDSTLSAIRLANAGYNVYLIHFDNGHMLDSDKPFLTWKKSFFNLPGYNFPYAYSKVNIKSYFDNYFENWRQHYGDTLEDGTMTSEVRCLACRSAMYQKTLDIAISEGFKYIADGARISQKFMLEQVPMTKRFSELASNYGISVLYPVLDLVDDDKEKKEIIEAGFSSKSWESKCLLGRRAMDKTLLDETIILEYFDSFIKPLLDRELQRSLRKKNYEAK